MIRWAGRLIVLVGAGHLLVALVLYARPHVGAWFRGELWGEDLAAMSPAGAALWLTVDSFAVPLILVGLTVLWLDRQGIAPPAFLAWTVGIWAVVEAVESFGPSPEPAASCRRRPAPGRCPPDPAPAQPGGTRRGVAEGAVAHQGQGRTQRGASPCTYSDAGRTRRRAARTTSTTAPITSSRPISWRPGESSAPPAIMPVTPSAATTPQRDSSRSFLHVLE